MLLPVHLTMLLSQPVMSGQGFADIAEKLARQNVKVARYEEKLVADYLHEPLISKGTLRFESPDKLTKIMTEPESITQQITGSEVIVTRKGGKTEHFSLTSYPGLEGMANTLRSLLSGDRHYLEQNYVIKFSAAPHGWNLILTPRGSNIKKWIKNISVEGAGGNITQYTVTEANGDYTVTSLYEDSRN